MTDRVAPGWNQFWEHYDNGSWEADTKSFLLQHLRSGSLFLDVGAWVGPVSMWAFDIGADVIAIEPDPEAQRWFEHNILTMQPHDHMRTWSLWLGAMTVHGGVVEIDRTNGDSQTSIVKAGGTTVESWTLEQILGNGKIPDLVKIDVEGYETELAPAIMPFLAKHGVPVQISLHGEYLDEALFSTYDFVDWPDNDCGNIRAYNKKERSDS